MATARLLLMVDRCDANIDYVFTQRYRNPMLSSRSPSSKNFSRPILLSVFKPVLVLGTGKLAELFHLNVISMG
jgi:hypothetical protein